MGLGIQAAAVSQSVTPATEGFAVTANAGTNLDTSALALEATQVKSAPGRKLGTGGQVLNINSTGARSTILAVGNWRISGNREIWFKQGASTVTAAKDTAGSVYLGGGGIDSFPVTAASDGYVFVIAGEDPTEGICTLTLEE
jgi:hypothetical protein